MRSGISSDKFLKPLKINKVNIGSPENPKFANIGDYWDEETVAKIYCMNIKTYSLLTSHK